ncbi:MAG TPA: hypothetical protein VFQ91_19610 [Bryobacteraceae bacterium]|nr:hypothetical protein [Bryobacteraceae bacterium]
MAAEWIGWVATAAFASSYFCREGRSLRVVQGLAAMLWIGYGVFIRATPVVVANVIVAAAAGYSMWRPVK